MKKRVLISLASAALLSVGAVGIGHVQGANAPQTVQAAKQVKAVKVKLTKNAVVYSSRGKRKTKKTLKKGHVYPTYGKKTIRGKKYYKLSHGRYIKINTASYFVEESNPTPIKPDNTNTSATSSTTDDFKVTIIKPARIYDSNGKKTAFTANKGTFRTVTGSKVINGTKYYKIGDNSYILASDIEKGIDNNVPKENINDPEPPDKPTQAEIDYLLANNNDKLGYTIYFSDSELAQIKNYLWQDIQNYRVEQGLPAYKTNVELDSLISKICASSDKMWQYEQDLAGATKITLAPYLPTMNANGMDMTDTWIENNYYGHRIVGEITPKEFNFKDRNPEHVATQIFNSCKNDKSYYNKMILGHNDKAAFASLGLTYKWDGTYSFVGIAFIEVSGTSAKWLNFYNAN
jgi:hypothetical protein